MLDSLWSGFKNLFDPVKMIYDEYVAPVLNYELMSRSDPTGNVGANSPVTVGGVLKDFAGGFLNLGESGSGVAPSGPYTPPSIKRINAARSTAGGQNFRSTQSKLATDFGFTNRAMQGLAKANTSDVQQIKLITQQLLNTANRRGSINTQLASSRLGNISSRTSFPKVKKPSYFG
jgi:hypothetical protein